MLFYQKRDQTRDSRKKFSKDQRLIAVLSRRNRETVSFTHLTYVHFESESNDNIDRHRLCNRPSNYTSANDSPPGIQHSGRIYPDMDQYIYTVSMPYSMDNPNSKHIRDGNLHTDFQNNYQHIDMRQHHFVHDKQH